jgi:hypothetical protein
MSFSIRHSNDVEDIIDISWREARSKTEVLIFEIGKMDDLMPLAQAEEIRHTIKDNKIRIRQLSNYERINKYTDVKDYEQLIQLRHIDEDIFKVSSEIVIFEDTVAIYRTKPSVTYLEINDSGYADMMRSLFESVWKVSDVMVLGMGGSEEAKQYKPISTKLKVGRKLIPAVIYPAKDDGVIEKAFKRGNSGGIEMYLQECALKFNNEFKKADLVLAYAWNDEKERIIDAWIITRNSISNDSGFLYDAITIKEGKIVKDMGIASGNSNIVITAEELLLRDLVLEKGLSFTEAADRTKYMPKFPPGMKPSEEFYLLKIK